MSAVQLSFSLRVSSGVKTVHLLGSWDGYVGQLPLSKDKSSSKPGSWKGTFRFQNSTLEAGQRYWYYYIIDGYHVAHNPSVSSTVEPTTGRELNVLDVPTDSHKSSSRSSSSKSSSKSSSSSSSKSSSKSSSSSHKSSSHKSSSSSKSSSHSSKDKESRSSRSSRHSSKLSVDIPKGRPLSISQIQAPKPMSPHATKHILDASYYDNEELEELADRLGSANIEDEFITDFSTSPVSSSGSSLSYRSDSSSPNSSLSGYSTPGSDVSSCTCERYGITRKGERVKLDCGGSRCGYDDDSDSICSSGSEDEYEYEATISHTSSRRHGVVA
ncbi:related to SRP40 Suppressor of mutant AC40 of RNA polymerase I and III [Fusarium torulosum]|uniref:Related to SRP40 Suppressor of mutant AC40 of RNA polymerase I and III n=1 Tax=Fusarium torulosum TaxID=33205 RepID=A0AAE8MLJ0_9HYPO|nr:related to SRP40 Suppressor of mutant AC40 of RNA polymerase I and III [Fusarium torulosum]